MANLATHSSLKLKIIFAYLYITLATYILEVYSFAFGSDQTFKEIGVFGIDERITALLAAIIPTLFLVWVLYLLHRRQARAGQVFAVFLFVSYSLWDVASGSDFSLAMFSLTIVFLIIDITIMLYLLKSKEAKALLKH